MTMTSHQANQESSQNLRQFTNVKFPHATSASVRVTSLNVQDGDQLDHARAEREHGDDHRQQKKQRTVRKKKDSATLQKEYRARQTSEEAQRRKTAAAAYMREYRARKRKSSAATVEQGVNKHVKEQSYSEMTIKNEVEETVVPSTTYIDIEIDLNHVQQEPGFVQFVKSEPALLVKEEILENSWQDGDEHQYVEVASTSICPGRNEPSNTSPDDLHNVKHEPREMDIGPTVLQHMDIHYTTNQINLNRVKQESGLAQFVKSEPAVLVKEEILEDSWQVYKRPKTNAEKCRDYRVRKKASEAAEALRNPQGVRKKKKPLTSTQRNRNFRNKKKIADINARQSQS